MKQPKHRWTPERDEILRRNWAEKKPLSQIAKDLGISPIAVASRVKQLCIPARYMERKQHRVLICQPTDYRIHGRAHDSKPLPPGSPETWGLISGGKPWPGDIAYHA